MDCFVAPLFDAQVIAFGIHVQSGNFAQARVTILWQTCAA